jgi:chaperonin cofactor prefoldin
MKRSLGKATGNSMELLLDTVCNMFGSIVLITLLIVIVTTDNPLETFLDESSGPDRETIDRLIHTANLQIADLRDKIKAAQTDSAIDPKKAARIKNLESRLQLARATLEQAKDNRSIAIETASPHVAKSLATLKEKEAQLMVEIAALENTIADAERRLPHLKAELQKLLQTHKNLKEKVASKIRLPKLRDTSKRAFYLILRYNQIFPLYRFSKSGYPTRHPSNKVDEISSFQIGYVPQRGKGIPADKKSILAEFENIPDSYYLTCFVYPDSAEAYRILFRTMVEKGMQVGWEPQQSGDDIIMTTRGGTPPPKPQ